MASSCQKIFPNKIRIISQMSQTRSMSRNHGHKVVHDVSSRIFYIDLPVYDRAILEYSCQKGIMDMYHTEVPPNHQGKGLAALLAEAAFCYAVNNQYQMKLTCTYLQRFYELHPKPEYEGLVTNEPI